MKEEIISEVKDKINYLLRSFSIAGEIIIKKSGENIVANIMTAKPEILIGKNGQTLLAIQMVIRAMVSRNLGEGEILTVDVEGYRQKHSDRLQIRAREAAIKVMASGEPEHLQPMTSYERRLVHLALADFNDISADSEGEGLSRHIVIKSKK